MLIFWKNSNVKIFFDKILDISEEALFKKETVYDNASSLVCVCVSLSKCLYDLDL